MRVLLYKKQGISAANILYATFDYPLMKMVGVDAVLKAWRERMPKVEGEEYIFLDIEFCNKESTK